MFPMMGQFPRLGWVIPVFILLFVLKLLKKHRRRDGLFNEDRDQIDDPDEDSGASANQGYGRRVPVGEAEIIRIANKNDGILTVTDVALDTGLSMKEAEDALNKLVDNVRVSLEVTSSGILHYEFKEIIDKKRNRR